VASTPRESSGDRLGRCQDREAARSQRVSPQGGRSSIIYHLIFVFMRGQPQSLSRQLQRPCQRSVASALPADVNVCRRSINVIHNGGYNKLNCRHARREFTRRKKQQHVRRANDNHLGAGDSDSTCIQHGEQNRVVPEGLQINATFPRPKVAVLYGVVPNHLQTPATADAVSNVCSALCMLELKAWA
jgi:hypothetical protein